MKTRYLLMTLMVALCLGACGTDNDDQVIGGKPSNELKTDDPEPVKPEEPEEPEEPSEPEEPVTRHSYKPVVLNEVQQAIHVKLQAFSWKLFKEVYVKREPGTNLMISPISLEVDLGMFINGLEGETLQEVLKTLGLESFTKEQINDFFKTMMTGIEKADEAAIFKSANAFWYNQNKKANQDFLSVIKDKYDAKAEAVNFSDPTTKDIINAWCSEKTNKRIEKMVDETDELHLFHLMNAVYFKAQWEDQFVKEFTQKQPFHYADGKKADVDMMFQQFNTSYAETDKYQQCVKPFVDGSFQMVFILPKEGVDLVDAIPDSVDYKVRATAEVYPGKPEWEEVALSVPKFTSEYTEENLFPYMGNINPSLVFLPEDMKFFENPSPEVELKALQKTFFLMDEEGAEAAAITDIMMKDTAFFPDKVFNMTLDRPFIYAIIESNTQCPLFIGYYGN